MSDLPLHVTVHDPATGETHTVDIQPGDYLLLCAPPAYRSGLVAHANGTHQITVRGVKNPMDGMFEKTVGLFPRAAAEEVAADAG